MMAILLLAIWYTMKLIFAFAELFVGLVLYHELIPSNAAGQTHTTQPITTNDDIDKSMNQHTEDMKCRGTYWIFIEMKNKSNFIMIEVTKKD